MDRSNTMPTYRITESWYEWRTVEIPADSEEDARDRLFRGEGDIVDGRDSDYEIVSVEVVE